MNKTNSGIGTSMGIWAAAAIVDIVLWLVNGEIFNIVNLFILLIALFGFLTAFNKYRSLEPGERGNIVRTAIIVCAALSVLGSVFIMAVSASGFN